jgi:hypothetical protein
MERGSVSLVRFWLLMTDDLYDNIIQETKSMSRQPVTVSLPEILVKQTTRFCKKHSVTLSEITREAIAEYLHRQTLDEARRAFTAHVQKRGLFSEKDLLRRLG